MAIDRILVGLEELEAPGARSIAVSIGIAALEPEQKAEALLAAARVALEQAWAAGGRQAATFGGTRDGEKGLELGHGDVIAALAAALQERERWDGDGYPDGLAGPASEAVQALVVYPLGRRQAGLAAV